MTFDTTRYDRIGCNGDPDAHTPNLDALAKNGTRFTRAFASVGLTLPSHTTILSGLEPYDHGVHDNGRYKVDASVTTLPEILLGAGYQTAAFVSASVLARGYGLSQGFEIYDDETEQKSGLLNFSVPTRPGGETTDKALVWLAEADRDRPYFLWVHYYDPHRPWVADEGFENMRDPYTAEIAYADAQLGRLLAGLPSRNRERLTVMTVDHGEGLGEHEEHTHGVLAYDGVLHVPLILAGPGVAAGSVSDAYVRHIDILPTVLRTLGLAVPEDLDGDDLRDHRALRNREDRVTGYFEAHTGRLSHGWAKLEGVRNTRWKYTALPEPPELYDLVLDRKELHNVVTIHAGVADELRSQYEQLRARAREISPAVDAGSIDLEQLQALRALGYVDAPDLAHEAPAGDPRRLVMMHEWVNQARVAATFGDTQRAIDVLEMLRSNSAVRTLALHTLAAIYEHVGRFDDAIGAYAEYVDLTGGADGVAGLARSLVRAGRFEETEQTLARWTKGRGVELVVLRATALAKLGRVDEARKLLDEELAAPRFARARRYARAQLVITLAPFDGAVEELRAILSEDPQDALLQSQLGFYMAVWAREGNEEAARMLLERAAAEGPENRAVLANLGWGLYRLGAAEEARRELEHLLEREPDAHMERWRLAHVLAELGEKEAAAQHARSALAAFPGAEWADEGRALLEALEGRDKEPPHPSPAVRSDYHARVSP